VDLAALAQATPGMSGADLANLANEAALTAARQMGKQVSTQHFEAALDRITLGAEGPPLMNEAERRLVAYHEGGHALVAALLPHVDPIHRVTIMPRGRSLGVTQFRPLDDRRNYRREYLLSRLAVGLGGRAAEEIACGESTSGAQNDLQQVAQLARAMVTQLGMTDELGLLYLGGSGDAMLTGPGVGGHAAHPWESKDYSEETARRIDAAMGRLIAEAHERARAVLTANRAVLDAIAEALIRAETLDRAELMTLIKAHAAPGRGPVALAHNDATPHAEAAAAASRGSPNPVWPRWSAPGTASCHRCRRKRRPCGGPGMRSESVYARVDPLATRPRDREYVRVSLTGRGRRHLPHHGRRGVACAPLTIRAPR
jgi:cell division protease FtsH